MKMRAVKKRPFRKALREKVLNGERDRALKSLAESELRFRTLVEASPDAIFVISESKIVFANPATIKLLGAQTPVQIIGKHISEFVHPTHLSKVKEQAEIDFASDAPSPLLNHILTRLDGSVVEVEGIGISILWGGLPAIEVISRDISERKQAEQKVLEWQKRLELAQNAALPIVWWEWSVDDDQLVWSGDVYRQFGFTHTGFRGVGADLCSRIHPEDLPRVERAMRNVITGSQLYETQFRVIRADGSVCWLDSRGAMVRDGKPRMIGIAIDITNLKMAEERLRNSEADYRSIIEDAPYGIYRSDFTKSFTMVNPTLLQILGYESDEQILSLDVARDVYADPEQRSKLWSQIRQTGSAIDREMNWKHKDGRVITVRNRMLPRSNRGGEIEAVLGFVEDVTERKVLEKQFWQAQKFEAIDRLAGGIAHDFNNVLMIIGSYAEIILESKSNDEGVLRSANHIRGAAERAASITKQLLAFSRNQILEPEVLNLNTVLTDLDSMLPKLLGEDIVVTITLDPALQQVKVDRGQMEQVIMNLAVNARDAMPNGGSFIVDTRNLEADDAYVAQRSPMLAGSYVALSITDTGTGMDAVTKARVFEPFFTTKERGRGTGLGLASVYGIVKQSGGFVWVASEVGLGSTFEIYFPQVEERSVRDPKPHLAKPDSGRSETILLVEDEAELRAVACGFLRSKGYTVLAARDGQEALRICEQHPGNIDALLTDVVMPGIDGIELAAQVASRHPEIHILYMSGYSDRSVEKLSAQDVLLQKPFKLSTLGSKLREVLVN